jgi:uncharacterized protein YecE (DUF72 family)
MWAHRTWFGSVLPAARAGQELRAYASLLSAVEGNTTFYALPDQVTVERWATQAPESFRFVCKLPQHLTHERRLRRVEAEVGVFLDRLAPLGPRLGPVSVQLPASFGPSDLPALDAFLRSVPATVSWAVELRHPAFFAGGTHERDADELLSRAGVDRVVLDSRALFAGPCRTPAEQDAFGRKPRLPVRPVALGRHPIVRFIGQTDPAANPPFWSRWVPVVARWLREGREPYVFVHTPDNRASPVLARQFHAEVAAVVDLLEPLPEVPGQLPLL